MVDPSMQPRGRKPKDADKFQSETDVVCLTRAVRAGNLCRAEICAPPASDLNWLAMRAARGGPAVIIRMTART